MLILNGLALISTRAHILTSDRVYTITYSKNLKSFSVIGIEVSTRAVVDSFITSDIRKVYADIDAASEGHIVNWILLPGIDKA